MPTDGDEWIIVRNWDRFQHRDAGRQYIPTWIKLYPALLSDENFLGLTVHRRLLLLELFMEFARAREHLTTSTRSLSKRLSQRVTRADLVSLNHAGFILFSASEPASDYASDYASDVAGAEEKRRDNPPTPLNDKDHKLAGGGSTAEPKTNGYRVRRRGESDLTYEAKNPYACGVTGCPVRDATPELIAEHRDNVHGLRPPAAVQPLSVNGHHTNGAGVVRDDQPL